MITLLSGAALPARLDDRLDVALDGAQVAGLERADVDHHVDLGRAVEDGPPRLVVLDVGGGRAERKADHRADADAAAAQQRARRSPPRPGSRRRSRSGTRPPRGTASRCRRGWRRASAACDRSSPTRRLLRRRWHARRSATAPASRRRAAGRGSNPRAPRGRRTATTRGALAPCAAITSSVMMSISRCRSCGFSTSVPGEPLFEPADLEQPPDVARLAHRACRSRCPRCGSRHRDRRAATTPASSRSRRCARVSSGRWSRRGTSPRERRAPCWRRSPSRCRRRRSRCRRQISPRATLTATAAAMSG